MSISVEPTVYVDGPDGIPRCSNLTSQLYSSRIIVLDGEVTLGSCSRLMQELLELEHEKPETPVTMIVSSPGGDVYAGLGLISVMQSVSCPVTTIACGLVASMAAVIAACGDHRLAYENSYIMMHQVMAGMSTSQQTDVRIMADQATEIRGRLDEILAAHCALTVEEVHERTERDCWLTAQEAVRMGLIDGIVPRAEK